MDLQKLAAFAHTYGALLQPQQQQQELQDKQQQDHIGAALQLLGLAQTGQSDDAIQQFRQQSLAQDAAQHTTESALGQQTLAEKTRVDDAALTQQSRESVLRGIDMLSTPNLNPDVEPAMMGLPGFDSLVAAHTNNLQTQKNVMMSKYLPMLRTLDPGNPDKDVMGAIQTATAQFPDLFPSMVQQVQQERQQNQPQATPQPLASPLDVFKLFTPPANAPASYTLL